MSRRKTILYASSDSESEYDSCPDELKDDAPTFVEEEIESPVPEAPVPKEEIVDTECPADKAVKPKGVRKRDLSGKRPKLHECPHCKRPYAILSALEKHESKCPVKVQETVKWAKKLKESDKAEYDRLKRKEYNRTQKERREAARPVIKPPVKKGRPLKPKPPPVQYMQGGTDSDDESDDEVVPPPRIVRPPPKYIIRF